MEYTYLVKMENGKAHLYKSNGVRVRTLCSVAKYGVIQGDEVHVTMANDKVRVYSIGGVLKRTI